jgi:hypothetical protein
MTIASASAAAKLQRAPDTSRPHWLVDVARRATLANSDLLTLAASTPIEEAWAKATQTCKVTDDQLAQHVAGHFRVAVAQLSGAESHALKLVPETVARRHKVLLAPTNTFASPSSPRGSSRGSRQRSGAPEVDTTREARSLDGHQGQGSSGQPSNASSVGRPPRRSADIPSTWKST